VACTAWLVYRKTKDGGRVEIYKYTNPIKKHEFLSLYVVVFSVYNMPEVKSA
jgi:hypothetical protein